MKHILLPLALAFVHLGFSQNPDWIFSADSVANLSSARSADLNADGIQDIVFGAGADGIACTNGILAINGANGTLLWKRAARNEVFGSAVFQDITADGIPDVFITGRQAQMLAINGANGTLIWDYFPYGTNPADSGLYNFYNPVFINDITGDGLNDIVVSNGGDHAAPVWDTDRPAGRMMLLDASNGSLLVQAIVPDSAEIYCSPVVADLWNDGNPWILYGTGGETLGGHFYACRLENFLQGSLASSIVLAEDNNLGYIAPASVVQESNGNWRVFIQSYGGQITCIDGADFSPVWETPFPGTESSAALALGNFTGSLHTDAFAVLFKGEASAYTDFYQVMIDGENGSVIFIDSIGSLHFASANAIDLNNDGLDEVLISTNGFSNGAFRNSIQAINFAENSVQNIINPIAGVNIASTPLVINSDNDSNLELFMLTRRDSINPSGIKGVTLRKFNLEATTPNSGIAWGSYMGTSANGQYTFTPSNCGTGSISAGFIADNPSCNNLSDGSLGVNLIDPNADVTYLWANGTTSETLTGIPAGIYEVRLVNNSGCYEDLTYALEEPYIITFGGIMPPSCPGDINGSATLNSTGCVCMFSTCTFFWDNGITSKTNSQLPEGWSHVTINHPDGCVVTDSIFIPAPAPSIEGATINEILCAGDANGSIELLPSAQYPPVSYLWSTGSNLGTLSNLIPGSYWVQVNDTRGCTDTLSFTIEERIPLQISAQTIPVSCHGLNDGRFEVEIGGGLAPYTMLVNDVEIDMQNSTFAPGEYVLYVLDANACISNLEIATIIEPNPLTVSVSSTPEQIANSLSGTATVEVNGGTPPYSFTWNDPNAQSDSIAVYLNTGTYEVLVTDAMNCSIVASVFVDALSLTIQSPSNNQWELIAFPNPTSGLLNFSEKVDRLTVYDAIGKCVQQCDQCESVSLELLNAGIYFVEAKLGPKSKHILVHKSE